MAIIEAIAENKLRLAIGNFLATKIFERRYFMVDIWAFVHLTSGALVMLVLNLMKLKAKWRYLLLITALIGYEIVEFFLYKNLTTIFIPETLSNVIFDVVVGLIGAGMIDLFFYVKRQ